KVVKTPRLLEGQLQVWLFLPPPERPLPLRPSGPLVGQEFFKIDDHKFRAPDALFGVRKLACALRAMEPFQPHKSGSKLPHSKPRQGIRGQMKRHEFHEFHEKERFKSTGAA